MTLSKVSVIITTYGDPERLEAAIMSVFVQSYKNWELIIVDDNDPMTEAREETDRLLNRLSDKVLFTHIRHEKNLNGSVARNTGYRASQGDYIAFLDSDDEYDPSRLMTCVSLMEDAHENYAGVYTGCIMKKGGKIYSTRIQAITGNYLIDSLGCVFEFYSGSNLFVRSEVYYELGGFDELLQRHQDYDFLARLFQHYDLIGVNSLLLIKNNDNKNLPDATRVLEIKKYYLEKHSNLLGQISPKEASFVRYCHDIAMSESFASEGNFQASLNHYVLAIKYKFEIIRLMRVITKYLKYKLSV